MEHWPEVAFQEAQKLNINEIYPIVILSYKRYDLDKECVSIKHAIETPNVKCYLFVYDFDYENYKPLIEGHSNIIPVMVTGGKGITYKRHFVIDWMQEHHNDRFFMMDDDIESFYWIKTNGQGKSQKVCCSFEEFLKLFTYMVKRHETDKEIGLGSIMLEMSCPWIDFSTGVEAKAYGCPYQMAYVNAKILHDNNINYDLSTDTWEDQDIFLQCIDKGVRTTRFINLTYYSKPMNPSKTVASVGDKKWTTNSMHLYAKWGKVVSFKPKKEQVTTRIKPSILKYIKDGRLERIYEPEYMQYIENNDIVGFEEYINAKYK